MTLENAKVWYKTFLKQGRIPEAADMLQKHPELAQKPSEPIKPIIKPKPKVEVK